MAPIRKNNSFPHALVVLAYEYASKASIASTAISNIVAGAVSHEQNLHGSHTLPEILTHVEASRGKAAKQGACDRDYRGKSSVNGTHHFWWLETVVTQIKRLSLIGLTPSLEI